MKIAVEKDAITELTFLESLPDSISQSTNQTVLDCIRQLDEYFKKELAEFDLPLAPAGTKFQKSVWTELQNIPLGKTVSYMDMAKRLGDPKVIRAAGTANGKNPIAVIIPCHRVIGSDGSLTGYAGGLKRKQWLLEHENSQTSLF